MAEEDTIARRREKRSTAGNRYEVQLYLLGCVTLNHFVYSMEAALAEIANEQLPPDADGEEDRDFIGADGACSLTRYTAMYNLRTDSVADEEEVFDSDFASTDEDEAPEEIEERAVQEEEKREHRVSIDIASTLFHLADHYISGCSTTGSQGN